MQIHRVAVVTSGGDCPGLNSALEAMARWSHHHGGWELVGLMSGVKGLMEDPVPLKVGLPYAQWAATPGTMLRGNSKGLHLNEVAKQYAQAFERHRIDALISIGGDGSLVLLDDLTRMVGIPFVAIPKTIDNDVPLTDWALGHASAVEEVRRSVDNIHATAYGHGRLFVVEVMGRDAGHLALRGGMAGCAHAILTPERVHSIAALANAVEVAFEQHGYAVVVVAEGTPMPDGGEVRRTRYRENEVRYGGIAAAVGSALGMHRETRFVTLGHTVRGVPPVAFDRMLAQMFAVAACECVKQQKFGHMVAWQADKIVCLPVAEVRRSAPPPLSSALLYTAEQLGIYIGQAQA